MADRRYRAQLILPHDNGLPKDAIVNTWHFLGSDALSDATNALDIAAQLDAFYTAWVPTLGSTQYNWDNCNVKYTVFEDPKPRLPFFEGPISPGTPPTGNADWPAEVAIVLSMEAARSSGVNMRRRRGRVYLGPLSVGPGDLASPQTTVSDVFSAAADAAFFGSGTCRLAVYSPYTHHGVPVGGDIHDFPDEIPDALPASFHEVVKCWCDNAWDTQRRRGVSPSYRSTVTR